MKPFASVHAYVIDQIRTTVDSY